MEHVLGFEAFDGKGKSPVIRIRTASGQYQIDGIDSAKAASILTILKSPNAAYDPHEHFVSCITGVNA